MLSQEQPRSFVVPHSNVIRGIGPRTPDKEYFQECENFRIEDDHLLLFPLLEFWYKRVPNVESEEFSKNENVVAIHSGEKFIYVFCSNADSYYFHKIDATDITDSSELLCDGIPCDGSVNFGTSSFKTKLLYQVSPAYLTKYSPIEVYCFGQWNADREDGIVIEFLGNNQCRHRLKTEGLWTYTNFASSRLVFRGGLEVAILHGEKALAGVVARFEITKFGSVNDITLFNEGNQTYFTGKTLGMGVISGNTVHRHYVTNIFNRVLASTNGEFCGEFFKHMIRTVGNRVYWSDLRNFWNWTSAKDSEADSLVVDMDFLTCTTIAGDRVYLHTHDQIGVMQYVGKPNIMQVAYFPGYKGCVNRRGLILLNGVQYYIGIDDFYMFDGQNAPKGFGSYVHKTFFNFSDYETFRSVFASVDTLHQEIGWFWPLIDGTTKGLIYNYSADAWTIRNIPRKVNCFSLLPKYDSESIGNLLVANQDIGTLVAPLPRPWPAYGTDAGLWIDRFGYNEPLKGEEVYGRLITHKLSFKNDFTLKWTDSLQIVSDCDSITESVGEPAQWTVYVNGVSKGNVVIEKESFNSQAPSDTLTFQPTVSKQLQYAFEILTNASNVRFYGWAERLVIENNESNTDV